MKKSLILFFVLIIAALSVMSVSAAPRDRYYEQMGSKHWCNSDSYGCWVTGENGEHEYIMFWSESARDAIMGPGSDAPLGTNPGTSELPLLPPNPCLQRRECEDGKIWSETKCACVFDTSDGDGDVDGCTDAQLAKKDTCAADGTKVWSATECDCVPDRCNQWSMTACIHVVSCKWDSRIGICKSY